MSELRQRKKTTKVALPEETVEVDDKKPKQANWLSSNIEPIVASLLFTLLAYWLRAYELDSNRHIIWDEAHFGKFGSYYLRHEFYHDVHPPLGKMLCGLSEYIAGFNNTKFDFSSGKSWPKESNVWAIRIFQVIFSTLTVPTCYFTCREFGYSRWSTYFITLMTCLECSFIVLGKFVLLDSFLIFFMATTYLGLSHIYRLRKKEFSPEWTTWMVITGVSIGCVCSVKWVGLFITGVVGVYTVVELYLKFWDPKFSYKTYAKSWGYRIATLIVIPAIIYILCFKIHYALLYKPGTGAGSMSSLFQVNLAETDFLAQPRLLTLDTNLTIRSQGPSPNLLHSHGAVYPGGSHQHQVTTYGYKDSNNFFVIRPARHHFEYTDYIKDGDVIRLQHKSTGSNLHSHEIHAHVSTDYWEVSGYGSEEIGDNKDDWQIEILDQAKSSNRTYSKLNENNDLFYQSVHPVSTTFRLRHTVLGCYLATTGASYPSWGFKQGEVVCKPSSPRDSLWTKLDKSTWWNVENLDTVPVPVDPDYTYPKSSFFNDFFMTQKAMAASNNGLVPDEDKFDGISSSWWEWPILFRGLRMSGWGDELHRYYMFSNPFNIWFSSLCLVAFSIIILRFALLWQRQLLVIDEDTLWKIGMTGVAPFLGWLFHYLPFVVMARVTYFHHYMPALYFAIFVAAFVVEHLTSRLGNKMHAVIYTILFANCLFLFYLFSPTCLSMHGKGANYVYMDFFKPWQMAWYEPFSAERIAEHISKDWHTLEELITAKFKNEAVAAA